MCPMDFDSTRLKRETFLEYVEIHRELSSTNDRGLALAGECDLPCPALVIAEQQTAGRGRGGNAWHSGPGALAVSVVLDRPDRLPPERVAMMSLAAGLATRATVARLAPESQVQVKWPNDVYLGERKVAGILTETSSTAAGRLVVGIGLNLNNSLAEAPAEVRRVGVSLIDQAHRGFDPNDVLIDLLIALESEFSELATSGDIDVARWRSHCLLTGRWISVGSGSRVHKGRCLGIGGDGSLRIASDDGAISLHAGEVDSW